jgi:glycosyltransferase involved in cell wall biosynthesis
MKSLNILMATTGFYPAESWGGPVKIVHQNALELCRQGHHVSIVATNLLNKKERVFPKSAQSFVDGLDVYYLQTFNIPFWPGTLGPTWLSRSASEILQQLVKQADVVHVNATRNAISINALRYAIQYKKPVLLQPHGTLPHIVNSIKIKKLFDRLFLQNLLRQVDIFIAGQKIEKEQIIFAGGHPDRIRVIPNGLSLTKTKKVTRGSFRQKYHIPQERKIILFLARINRKKGTDLLIEAFARIPANERADMQLVVAGPDDGQLAEIQKLLQKYNLTNQVLLPGLLTGEDVWAAYADADLFVLPCRVDTFPMALIEACSNKVPIVVTETCEIADILQDKVAKVVPVEVDAIATGMRQVLQDDSLQQRYKQGAKELMQTFFSIEAVGNALEAVYYEAIESRRDAQRT